MTATRSYASLLQTRDGATGRYFGGAFFDTVSSALFLATLTWVASGAPSAVVGGLVMFAGVVPGVLTAAIIGGSLVDDRGADWVLTVTMSLRCLIMLAWVVVAHWTTGESSALIGAVAIAFFFDGLTGLHSPAVSAYTADLVPGGMQLLARLASATVIRLAQLLGMGIGAWLVAEVHVTSTASVAFVCLVISWMLYRSVRQRLAVAPGERITGGGNKHGLKATLEGSGQGWRIIAEDPALLRSVILQASVSIGTAAAITAGLPFRVRGSDLPTNTFALGMGTYLFGVLAASIAALRQAPNVHRPVRVGLSAGLCAGIAVLSLGMVTTRSALLPILLIAGLAVGIVGPMLSGYRAQRTVQISKERGDSVVGRVEAAVTVLQLIEPVGYPVMGLLVAAGGSRMATAIIGVWIALAALFGLASREARMAERQEMTDA